MSIKTVTIRMPDDLLEAIKLQAEREERSINGQIVFLLRRAIEIANA